MPGIIGNGGATRHAIIRAGGIFGRGGILATADTIVYNYDLTANLPTGITFTRASTATRWNSAGALVTAAIDAARFDYDPLTLAPLGILIESARTNKIRYSSDFTNAAWGKGASPFAVSGNAQIAPDGTTTADTLTLTSNNSSGYDTYQNTTGYTAGTTMVVEGWVKLGTATNFALVINNNVAWNTVGGKTFTAADGLNTSTWKRISYTFTMPATGTVNLHLGCHGQTGQTQQAAGTVHLWGFQITAQAGSEIPTTSASVVQAADNLKLPVPDGVWDMLITDSEGAATTRVSVFGGQGWPAAPRSGKNHIQSVKATLVRSYSSGLDSDAMTWLTAQGITDPALQAKYLSFTTLSKALTPTLWSRLMLVPCRDGEGYLSNFGGGISTHPSQLRGNFREVGTVTKSAAGASIAYAANWANRIETPSGYVHGTHRSEPTFMGMVYKNTISGAKFQNSAELLRWNVGTTSTFISNYSGGDSQTGAWQKGIAINGAISGQFIAENALANNSVDAPQFVGFDFQNGRFSVAQLANERYQLATHASASPATSSITTGLYFYPGIKSSGGLTGQLQYLIFISGGVIDIASEAKKFWDILRGTLLSDVVAPIHFHQGGQSLSSGYLQRALQMVLNTDRTVTTTTHTYGGTPISNWVGSNPASPARGSQYTGGFYKGDGTGAAEAGWPFSNSTIPSWIVWLQGESDTEARSTATVYQQQLTNLLAFLDADLGSNLKMAVNLCDYAIAYRTGSLQGDFTLSGLSGSGSSANGAWAIAAISATVSGAVVTNASTSYSWTKSGGGTISKNGSGLWEIAISGTVYATADQIVTHPELVTSWTLASGTTGTPAFSESRTGNIERVRAAQAAFAAANATRVVTFDSRGVTRPVDTGATSDAVHPDNAGQDLLASRAKTAILSLP